MAPESGPFRLDHESAYRRWRGRKLGRYPKSLQDQRVSIAALDRLTEFERDRIVSACRRANFALYQTDADAPPSMDALRAFGEQLGLHRFDRHLWAPEQGIVALRRELGKGRARYVPYTDRPMKWHTDGYYNTVNDAVRGV
ncbi:MAG: taurine catabolism dioxygenase TauD, partial [Gammaproteobacteria bacterium]|nr:taurine catabolism dioxygenase TauD [Gammaproteobacteria bacterium]